MAKQHLSVRLPERDRGLLQDEAERTRVSESELVRRYVAEGIRRDRHPGVTFRKGRVGGRPALESRPRLEILAVVETWKMEERDEAAVARYHDITTDQVRAALDYYAEFKHEIDAVIQDRDRLTEHREEIARARLNIV